MEKFYKNIEAYLREELSEADKQDFEQQLSEDEQLSKKFDQYKTARPFYTNLSKKQKAERETRATLNTLNDRYFPTEKKTVETTQNAIIIPLWRKLIKPALAAASILLLIFAMNWFSNTISPTLPELAGQYYSPKKTPATLGNTVADILQTAYQNYQAKNYQEAIKGFSAIAADQPRYLEAQLFLAYSYFENRQFQQALPHFEVVAQSGDSRFAENAAWNQALALLSVKNKEAEAHELLKRIANNKNHAFSEDAEQLTNITGSTQQQ